MNFIVKDDKAFQVRSNTLMIDKSTTGYTLYSAIKCNGPDDINDASAWSAYSSAIPANFQHLVNEVAPGTWFRLVGNVGEVIYTY